MSDLNHISESAILGNVNLGENIYIGHNSVIGTSPQHIKLSKIEIIKNNFKELIIENDVIIMDLCHIHAGIEKNTIISSGSIIMSGTHIGHDVFIGKNANISPNVAFAGEVTLGNDVTIGMGSTIHQRVKIGSYAMAGMGSVIVTDLPPFCTCVGIPSKPIKINKIKLKRLSINEEIIEFIHDVLIKKNKERFINEISLIEKNINSNNERDVLNVLKDWFRDNGN